MCNIDVGFLIGLLITVSIILAIALISALSICSVYKKRCARLAAENRTLRRTIKGQGSLRSASDAAYQEMLNAAFGARRGN